MTQAWFILTRADGRDICAPSPAQLADALAEVYAVAASRRTAARPPSCCALATTMA